MSRRLAVETLESRLMLSGAQLDDAIWNIDTLGVDYASIPQGQTDLVSTVSGGRAAGRVGDDRIVVLELLEFLPPTGGRILEALTDPSVRGQISGGRGSLVQLAVDLTNSGNFPNLSITIPILDNRTSLDFKWLPLDVWSDFDGGIEIAFDHPYTTEVQSYGSDEPGAAAMESEGGAIPIDSIVANLAGSEMQHAGTGSQLVDWTARRGVGESVAPPAKFAIAGELARAVAFEMLDGDAAPMAYAAVGGSGDDAATGGLADSAPRILPDLDAEAARNLAAASYRAANSRGAELDSAPARTPDDAVHALPEADDYLLAALPWAAANGPLSSDAPADAARAEAYSRIGGDSERSDERLDDERRSHVWLAAVPVLAVLAAERLVASKRHREREAAELPVG